MDATTNTRRVQDDSWVTVSITETKRSYSYSISGCLETSVRLHLFRINNVIEFDGLIHELGTSSSPQLVRY
jgi:hypothetical protein